MRCNSEFVLLARSAAVVVARKTVLLRNPFRAVPRFSRLIGLLDRSGSSADHAPQRQGSRQEPQRVSGEDDAGGSSRPHRWPPTVQSPWERPSSVRRPYTGRMLSGLLEVVGVLGESVDYHHTKRND